MLIMHFCLSGTKAYDRVAAIVGSKDIVKDISRLS